MPSVRELVVAIQVAARADNYTPGDAAEAQKTLAALLGNVNNEIRIREMVYKRFRLKCYTEEKAASRAKMVAEASPEYESYQEAKNLKEELIELKRSLKVFLDDLHEERKYSGSM